MNYVINFKTIFRLIFFIIIFINLLTCSNTYHIDNAPKPKGPIADYENLFSKKEYKHLLQIIKEIKIKYNVEVHILTMKSINNHSMQVFFEKVDELWGHKYDPNKKGLSLTLSKDEKIFILGKSPAIRKILNRDIIREKEIYMRKIYFREMKYFEGIKYLLEEIMNELQRNSKVINL